MKVEVDQELCISCGACVNNYPEIYDWNDDGKAEAVSEEIPSEEEENAIAGLEACPTDAIKEIK